MGATMSSYIHLDINIPFVSNCTFISNMEKGGNQITDLKVMEKYSFVQN